MTPIKHFIKSNPKMFRLLQKSRGLSAYSQQRATLEAFDHDSLSERFRITILSKSKYFFEYSYALLDALNDSGVKAALCSEITEDDRSHAILVVGGHTVDKFQLLSLQKKYVLAAIQTEQICSVDQGSYQYAAYQLKKFKSYAPNIDVVFDWHRENGKALKAIHSSVHYVPHGGLPEKQIENRNDDFELAFFGNVGVASGRRAKILKELSKRYTIYPETAGIWGNDKVVAFNSSKIILNLHAEASLTFESPRFYEATSYGRLVVSEPIFDSHPFEAGNHFSEAQLSEIMDTVDFYLSNRDKRQHLEKAAQKMAQEHSIRKSAKMMRDAMMLRHYLLTNA